MLAGIDIGGSKTELSIAAGAKRVGRSMPTSDWRTRTDPQADAASLIAAIMPLGGSPDILVVGSHGCDTDDECRNFQQRLAGHFPGTVLVLNDAELLLAAAGKERGIAVIAGTGSIAVARKDDRRMIAAGGWGWYLGDEGSASGLVREAARAVRGSIDAGQPLEQLGHGLLQALEIDSPVELGRSLSDRGSAAKIGSLAPVVFEAAEAGSRLALEVIGQAGQALAALTTRVLGRGAPGIDVVTGGGVIMRQPRLFDAFRNGLSSAAPQLSLSLLKEPPVTGAIALAERLQAGERPSYLPLPHLAGRAVSEAEWRTL